MFLVLMLGVFIVFVIGIFYLITRISKFGFMEKISQKKIIRKLISVALLLIICALMWKLWGMMNVMVCIIHLMFFWLLSDVIFVIITRIRKQDFCRYYAGGTALTFTLVYLSVAWVLAHNVQETNYTIHTDKKVGNLKVAFISDSHLGATFNGEGFAKHIKRIAEQNPDILVITGDFVDDYSTKEDMIRACEAFGEINIKYGIYYVYGNHDKGYYGDEYRGYSGLELASELEKNGVTVLEDESVIIDDRFYIIGRQDKSVDMMQEYGRADMQEIIEELDEKKFSIVLDHQPSDYAAQAKSGVDLVLSGHTHGGQLFPLMVFQSMPSFAVDDLVYGKKTIDDTDFIVTSGIADWLIKFRTGCTAEYVIVTIEGK